MLNEIELSYWHALNIANNELWLKQPKLVYEELLTNALFAKVHCNPNEEA